LSNIQDFGILLVFIIGFLVITLVVVELDTSLARLSNVLLFKRGTIKSVGSAVGDDENGPGPNASTKYGYRQGLTMLPEGHQDEPIMLPTYGVDEYGRLPANSGDVLKQRTGSGYDIQEQEPAMPPANHEERPVQLLAETRKIQPESGDVLTWQNVNYVVPVADGERKLLDDVSGYAVSGKLTALMGESGAGKVGIIYCMRGISGVRLITDAADDSIERTCAAAGRWRHQR